MKVSGEMKFCYHALLVDLRKRIPFTVVADNSLFTVYTFQAQRFNSASVKPKSPKVPSELRYSVLHVGCEDGV